MIFGLLSRIWLTMAGQHLDRLVKEVAAAAFSSTIGDLRLVFQGGQQVVAL